MANNKFDGEGIIVFPDGSLLFGNFKKGSLYGFFIVRYFSGDVMVGSLTKNTLNGLVFFFSKAENVWYLLSFIHGKLEKTILVQESDNGRGF